MFYFAQPPGRYPSLQVTAMPFSSKVMKNSISGDVPKNPTCGSWTVYPQVAFRYSPSSGICDGVRSKGPNSLTICREVFPRKTSSRYCFLHPAKDNRKRDKRRMNTIFFIGGYQDQPKTGSASFITSGTRRRRICSARAVSLFQDRKESFSLLWKKSSSEKS